MRLILAASLVAFLFALSTLPTVAPEQNVAKLLILHDVRDDGYTYQHNPNQFAFLMLTAEGTTTVHKQGKIVITQNGVKLYETQGGATGFDGAHDYDAFNSFVFAFPTTGPYKVHAEIPTPPLTADFEGFVHPIPSMLEAALDVAPPASPQAGAPATFTIGVKDLQGKILPHTDAVFEVRRASDNFLLFRTHTHTHDEPMKLDYRFPEAGAYRVRVTGYNAYPGPDDPGFVPVSRDLTVQVGAGAAGTPRSPMADPPATAPAPTGKYAIHATYDPDDMVGPFGNIRLNAVVLDSQNRTAVPHVDFKAKLTDPNGAVVFRSDSLHEYDGNLEVLAVNGVPGDYRMLVEASADGWKGWKDFTFSVVKPTTTGTPLTPYSAGPIIVNSSPLTNLKSGEPSVLEFSMKNLAGAAHPHSEIDLQVHAGTALGVPLLQNKLHTHSDGHFKAEYTFPLPGDYLLLLDAESVHGDFTPSYHYKELGGKLTIPVKVAQGPALVAVSPPAPPEVNQKGAELPAPGLALAVLALVGVLVFRRQP